MASQSSVSNHKFKMPLTKVVKKYKKPEDRSISQPRDMNFKKLLVNSGQYSSHRNFTRFEKFRQITKAEFKAKEEAEFKLERYMKMGFSKNLSS